MIPELIIACGWRAGGIHPIVRRKMPMRMPSSITICNLVDDERRAVCAARQQNYIDCMTQCPATIGMLFKAEHFRVVPSNFPTLP